MALHVFLECEHDGISFEDDETKHSDGVSGYPMALGIEPRIETTIRASEATHPQPYQGQNHRHQPQHSNQSLVQPYKHG
jgi:hypothetical protein